jgi:hypothetical protein
VRSRTSGRIAATVRQAAVLLPDARRAAVTVQVPTPIPDSMQVSVSVVSGDADLYIKRYDPAKCVRCSFLVTGAKCPHVVLEWERVCPAGAVLQPWHAAVVLQLRLRVAKHRQRRHHRAGASALRCCVCRRRREDVAAVRAHCRCARRCRASCAAVPLQQHVACSSSRAW